MKRKKIAKAVNCELTLSVLTDALSIFISEETRQNGLLIDLVDLHEICLSYLNSLYRLLKKQPTAQEFEEFLCQVDIDILEHLPYHLRSLKKLLPRAMRETRANAVGGTALPKHTSEAKRPLRRK